MLHVHGMFTNYFKFLSGISIKTIFTRARAHILGADIFLFFVYIFLVADWSMFLSEHSRSKK